MRRKSERSSTKKTNPSPEKKVEKAKRTRTRRRKQSTSSENESAEEASPVVEVEKVPEPEKKPLQTPIKAKEDSPEETPDQVWQVKTTDGDVGEIQKLKICLTRPPSTPERVDRSPRSRRKHSRATSSSDTPSVEPAEDKKKSKHRSKRTRESKDDSDKVQDGQVEEIEAESEVQTSKEKSNCEVSQSYTAQKSSTVEVETPMSTTNEENKSSDITDSTESSQEAQESSVTEGEGKTTDTEENSKTSYADTTVVSPEAETTTAIPEAETTAVSQEPEPPKAKTAAVSQEAEPPKAKTTAVSQEAEPPKAGTAAVSPVAVTTTVASVVETTATSPAAETTAVSHETKNILPKTDHEEKQCEIKESLVRKRSVSVDKSEVLELHAEENRLESPEKEVRKSEDDKVKEDTTTQEVVADNAKVSKTEDKTMSKEPETVNSESSKVINIPDIVDSPDNEKGSQKKSTESQKDQEDEKKNQNSKPESERHTNKVLECSDSKLSYHEETNHNGQAAPIVINRKRRWGSRVTKLTTQKSITISTDILKDIIPDVKPVEFDEVIEEKKHKRIDASEKLERPVLPKIVIDNTENVELNRKENEDKDKEKDVGKNKETNLAINRKISIVKDNDSIIARPPSPPKHKQSCILYITNLVRPFTLTQLKNLLQRTGRIAENGFWIDRIKSKCYVRYETEDQAVETRHALHGVTWPVSNPKTLQVDFSSDEAFDKAKLNEESDNAQVSKMSGTVEDWLREQDIKRERGELDKPWERKAVMREWDVGKNEKDGGKDKEKEKLRRDERPIDKRRHRTPERSPEPARKFKKKEEEAPAKLLDDLFRKTKATPCIYWLPLSADTIAIKEEQRRQHMAEHERRLQEIRRTHRRH